MEKRMILSKKDKKLIRTFLKHYVKETEIKDGVIPYQLVEDFIGTPKEDLIKYNGGMRFMLGYMLHQLPHYKTPKQQLTEWNEEIRLNSKSMIF
jgi:hypothetical protein